MVLRLAGTSKVITTEAAPSRVESTREAGTDIMINTAGPVSVRPIVVMAKWNGFE